MSYSETYRRRDHRARHQNAPLLKERDEYQAHLLGRGSSPRRVRRIGSMLRRIIHFLDLKPDSTVTFADIESAALRWTKSLNGSRAHPLKRDTLDEFKRSAANWLRYRGVLVEAEQPRLPYGDVLPDFISHIRNTVGMTHATVVNSRNRLLWFLRWAEERRPAFADVSLEDIEQYVAYQRAAGLKLRTIVSSCQTLRTFYGYAEARGLTRNVIAHGIKLPSVPRYDPGPKGPSWRDVRRLIAACPREKATDLRARAILLLLAVYGLRSSEITNLKLSDFDWVDESFVVRRAKRGGAQRFPLQFEVGEAILNYLKAGRPACSCRNLFITSSTPYRELSVGTLYTILRRRIQLLGIRSPQSGARAFRHACATQLLRKGCSLPEIADFLGHRNTNSVSIYAQPSASSLRQVAAFGLDGLR